jgi:ribonuclease J
MLKIIPLGGLGEIGLNMMVMEYDDVIFIIDAGLMFPENYMLGVDIVIPAMDYIRENKNKLKAVVITHAHEDHIGALPYLLKEIRLPVYGTAFTLAIIKHKLIEFELDTFVELNLVSPGDRLTIDPFVIEFIRVSHSTVDGVGLAIKTPEGVVIHTGDFRISHDADRTKNTDIASFARFGEEGVVVALMSDSTNVEVEGYSMSEQEVASNLEKYIIAAPGRVMVALFASNVYRIQQVIDIAVKNRRKVVFIGRSMDQTLNIASELGYIQSPENTIIDIKQINNYRDDELIFITTGSQGEPMSALTRMASGMHKYIRIKKGDCILMSSRNIPGNEKAIFNTINKLYRRGAEVIYAKMSRIHSSGHAHQEELRLMLDLIRPRYFIPIHGEYRHLVIHARLAERLGMPKENVLVAENGKVIAFDKAGARIHSTVYTGRILVDGKGIGDVGRSILKERWEMAEGGLVVVSLIIDEETGVVLHGPELLSKGFVFDAATGHLVDDAQCVILEIVEESDPFRKDRIEWLKKQLRQALRQYFSFAINRKPLIVPIIIEV